MDGGLTWDLIYEYPPILLENVPFNSSNINAFSFIDASVGMIIGSHSGVTISSTICKLIHRTFDNCKKYLTFELLLISN